MYSVYKYSIQNVWDYAHNLHSEKAMQRILTRYVPNEPECEATFQYQARAAYSAENGSYS